MTANHTSILPNVLSAITFFIPCLIFFIMKLYFISLFYQFAILFLLVVALSNTKWENEINKKIDPD